MGAYVAGNIFNSPGASMGIESGTCPCPGLCHFRIRNYLPDPELPRLCPSANHWPVSVNNWRIDRQTMEENRYAIQSLDAIDWSSIDRNNEQKELTERLGCSHTSVRAYRTQSGTAIALEQWQERLVVPIDGSGTLVVDGNHYDEEQSIALVQAGVPAKLLSDSITVWLVVSVPAEPTSEVKYTSIDVNGLEFDDPETSPILTARVTDTLDCCGMKVNVRRLDQDEAVPYHTEGSQEEIYVPYDGPGQLRVNGTTLPVKQGTVCRFAPEIPRSAVNPTNQSVRWVMVGAPPTGDAEEWDPGAKVHEWPEADSEEG